MGQLLLNDNDESNRKVARELMNGRDFVNELYKL